MVKSNLNIANIQTLCEENSIPYTNSTKLYYKRYAYNLTLKHVSLWSQYDRRQPGSDISDIRELHWQFIKIYDNLCKILDKKEVVYRTRRELNFNLYFDDPTAFKVVLKMVPDYIIALSGPVNQSHLATMRDSRKVVVRENLWYKKYKFKISYKATNSFKEDTVPAIMDFKKSLTHDEIKLSNNIYRIIQEKNTPQRQRQSYSGMYFGSRGLNSWNTCSIYFDNEDNFVMYKMMVPGNPYEELEILLVHELDCDK